MGEVVFQGYLMRKESSFVTFVTGQGQKRSHLPAEGDIITGSSWERNWICHYDFTAAAKGEVGLGGCLGVWVIH